jgi:hypothetical protein
MLPTLTPPLTAKPAVVPPPTAVPVPFRDLGPGRCHAFLAGQEGAEGLCCGRRVKRRGGRSLGEDYCDEHRPLFVVKARW